MTDFEEINCNKCSGHCNSKGYPSAMKGSFYCRTQHGFLGPKEKEKKGIFASMKAFLGR